MNMADIDGARRQQLLRKPWHPSNLQLAQDEPLYCKYLANIDLHDMALMQDEEGVLFCCGSLTTLVILITFRNVQSPASTLDVLSKLSKSNPVVPNVKDSVYPPQKHVTHNPKLHVIRTS